MSDPQNLGRIHHNGHDYVPSWWVQGNLDAMDRCCGELETAEKRIAAIHADLVATGDNLHVCQVELGVKAERIAALEAALEALGGSPKDMLDFCQAHGLEALKPYPVVDTWRTSIVRYALAGAR